MIVDLQNSGGKGLKTKVGYTLTVFSEKKKTKKKLIASVGGTVLIKRG